MEKAGGVGKTFILEESNILVNGSTLEIHLYWAGKGTTAIPDRGVYGPLISGITVTPSKKISFFFFVLVVSKTFLYWASISSQLLLSSFAVVDFDVEPGTLSAGAIAGIVVGSFVFVVLVLAVLRWKGYLGGKETEDSGKISKVINLFVVICEV